MTVQDDRSSWVYFEGRPERTLIVKRACATCDRFFVREHGDKSVSFAWPLIVSPNGVAHVESSHNEGHTACGKDATGPDWWWRT